MSVTGLNDQGLYNVKHIAAYTISSTLLRNYDPM